MSVDFEFRNKKKMWSYSGTPSYSALKKYFTSGRARGVKVVPLPPEHRMFPVNAFSLDCGGGCWLHIYDTKISPTIKMSHFDHVERAMDVLQKAAAFFDVVVLNDLEHGDSDVWANQKPGTKKPVKKSSFGITLKPINLNFGLKGLKR